MARLFDAQDAAPTSSTPKTVRRNREEARARAAEFDQMLAAEGIETVGPAAIAGSPNVSVQAISYRSYRQPGRPWKVEHAQDGEDYVYQVFPLRPTKVEWNDVIAAMIATMDAIFPRTIDITYKPPDEMFKLSFYTIRVKKIVGQPGWENVCKERVLSALVHIDAWPA